MRTKTCNKSNRIVVYVESRCNMPPSLPSSLFRVNILLDSRTKLFSYTSYCVFVYVCVCVFRTQIERVYECGHKHKTERIRRRDRENQAPNVKKPSTSVCYTKTNDKKWFLSTKLTNRRYGEEIARDEIVSWHSGRDKRKIHSENKIHRRIWQE